jgi:hypothetical protein
VGSELVSITKQEASRIWRGYPDTAKVVKAMLNGGWLIVREGKHFRAYCPCTPEIRKDFSFGGTPGRDGQNARRLGDQKAKCPDKHEHMR